MDLGELTARWLEGGIDYMPGYLTAGPDEETEPLVKILAQMNRTGFITTSSQPGTTDGRSSQRAMINAFCDAETASRLKAALLPTELIMLVHPPDAPTDGWPPLLITRQGPFELTWIGPPLAPSEIGQEYGQDLGVEAFLALCTAFQVIAIDPRWGRDDLLWPTIAGALGLWVDA